MTDIAVWIGGSVTAIGALAVAYRERRQKDRLVAETQLENERQESTAQKSMIGRMEKLEHRIERQAELISDLRRENMDQGRQISDLRDENKKQGQQMAKQDRVIRRQAKYIGDQRRTNKSQVERITQLEADVLRKDLDNAALAREMNDLRDAIKGSSTKPSNLPPDLYTKKKPI